MDKRIIREWFRNGVNIADRNMKTVEERKNIFDQLFCSIGV